jgi:hypothetical protein
MLACMKKPERQISKATVPLYEETCLDTNHEAGREEENPGRTEDHVLRENLGSKK